jgi:membrane-associated HD superfamily phosphohydrolase
MNIIMTIVFIWFVIGAFSFHCLMSEKDRKSMYQNKISFVIFMILAPITIVWMTLKTIFSKN